MCVDWRYLREREPAALQKETGWLKRQGVRLVVDLSSGVNLYPTLRLIDNLHADYEASLAAINDVLVKMEILGARDLIVSLHRDPENNFTAEQTSAAFVATLKTLASQAAARGVALHLRVCFGKPPLNLAEALAWLDRVGAPNLKLALSTAFLEPQPPSPETAARLKDKLGLWLISTSRRDAFGKIWDAHAPIHSAGDLDALIRSLAISPATPAVLDALLDDHDAEYLDAMAFEKAIRQINRPAK